MDKLKNSLIKLLSENARYPNADLAVFVDGEEFATMLLKEQKVAVVPGDAFGEFGKYYVRCSYAYSMKTLISAIQKIAEFVKNLK